MDKEGTILALSVIFGLVHVATAVYGLYAVSGSTGLRIIVLSALIFIVAASPVYVFLRYSIILPLLFSLYIQFGVVNEVIYGYSVEPSIVIYFSPIIQILLISGLAVLAVIEYGVRAQIGIFPPSSLL
ncbi:hypothetical protein [Natrialba magadii]|uniref:hypothetical protein n=1 Tax=Natrialba magadii TaxID=13769 RepID=UPI0011D0CE8E|nr:hypothetical protein [Natrialba magadii]